MDKTSTLNLFLRFYYNETEFAETVEAVNAMDADPLVLNEYKELTATLDALDEALLSPSDHTIKAIMDYSQTAA